MGLLHGKLITWVVGTVWLNVVATSGFRPPWWCRSTLLRPHLVLPAQVLGSLRLTAPAWRRWARKEQEHSRRGNMDQQEWAIKEYVEYFPGHQNCNIGPKANSLDVGSYTWSIFGWLLWNIPLNIRKRNQFARPKPAFWTVSISMPPLHAIRHKYTCTQPSCLWEFPMRPQIILQSRLCLKKRTAQINA